MEVKRFLEKLEQKNSMIDKKLIIEFIYENFKSFNIELEEFKADVLFIEINFKKQEKLLMVVTNNDIRLSLIEKQPEIDFSTYEFVFTNEIDAINYLNKIKTRNKVQ